MSKKMKEIMLFTENCDSVIIPKNCIETLVLSKITKLISFKNHNKNKNTSDVAGSFFLRLNSNARPLNFKMDSEYNKNDLFSVFLNKYNNLCAIRIVYDDNSCEEYDLAWPYGEDYINTYQQTKFNSDLNVLEIEVKENSNENDLKIINKKEQEDELDDIKDFLSYEQKIILITYKYFYKKNYSVKDNRVNKSNTLIRHVNVHQIIYLFGLLNFYAGDYYFSWSNSGPFSKSLQNIIEDLDKKENEINEYYQDLKTGAKLLPEEFFYGQQEKYINKIVKYDYNGEIIGSLAFLANNYYPNSDFSCVNNKLKELIPYLNNDEINKKAWNLLKILKVIPNNDEIIKKQNNKFKNNSIKGYVKEDEPCYKKITYVKPIQKFYDGNSSKYICPVCSYLGNSHQLTKGQESCPLCNVNLMWGK